MWMRSGRDQHNKCCKVPSLANWWRDNGCGAIKRTVISKFELVRRLFSIMAKYYSFKNIHNMYMWLWFVIGECYYNYVTVLLYWSYTYITLVLYILWNTDDSVEVKGIVDVVDEDLKVTTHQSIQIQVWHFPMRLGKRPCSWKKNVHFVYQSNTLHIHGGWFSFTDLLLDVRRVSVVT